MCMYESQHTCKSIRLCHFIDMRGFTPEPNKEGFDDLTPIIPYLNGRFRHFPGRIIN
jgi:hypothetical protein